MLYHPDRRCTGERRRAISNSLAQAISAAAVRARLACRFRHPLASCPDEMHVLHPAGARCNLCFSLTHALGVSLSRCLSLPARRGETCVPERAGPPCRQIGRRSRERVRC